MRNRHHADCRVAVERAAERYTLICDGPLIARLVASSTSGGSAAGGDASVDHLRDRFRLAVLGARPRRSRRSTEAAPQRAAAGGLAVSQDENDDAVVEVAAGSSKKSGWVPIFVDYLYVSLTNSSAFSPTDTMPLTSRAKALMGLQATAALLTSLIVIARAVVARRWRRLTAAERSG